MFFLILHSLLLLKRCAHDDLMKSKPVNTIKVDPNNQLPVQVYGDEWKNIRIQMDYRFFYESSSDKYMCRYPGQILTLNDTEILCNSSDLLTVDKRDSAITTIDNVKNFVERFIQVRPAKLPIKIYNYSDETSFVDEFAYGVDLHITILTRPESYVKALAGSMITSYDYEIGRPLTGVIIINPSAIEIGYQSEKSFNNGFYNLILHQVFHILGISSTIFGRYHDVSGSRHSFIQNNITKGGRVFRHLITPKAQIYAQKHYGIEYITDDSDTSLKVGIELEDAPGEESHLEMRTFFTEVMTGGNYYEEMTNSSFYRLTDATIAILEDTGNYKCDWKLAQPLVWGNPEVNGSFIKDFAFGSPQKVFPEDYTNPAEGYDSATNFDYKHYGLYLHQKRFDCNVSDKDSQYCKFKSWYNPNDWNTMTDDQSPDYMVYPIPINSCKEKTAILPTNLRAPSDQKCGQYNCTPDNSSFTIRVYSNTTHYEMHKCNKSNIGVRFKYDWVGNIRYLWCPDPERFCRTMKVYESYFQSDPLSKF